jgi:GET complex subunit GET2
MMLGLDRAGPGTPPTNPFAGGQPPMPGMEGMQDDPMVRMLSQMMGGGMPGGAGAPGGPGGGNPFAGTPLDSLFSSVRAGGGPQGAQAQQAQQGASVDGTANLWRILHALFAVGLGLYVALSTTFTGTLTEREHSTITARGAGHDSDAIDRTRAYFFYVFTSVEAILLTTRYFVDKSRPPPSGIAWTVAGFLPGSLGGYARHALRYAQILSTIRTDALVCVFVLGVCSWLRA